MNRNQTPSLFTPPDAYGGHSAYDFDGATFDRRQDGDRLTTLFDRVFALMTDGTWRTFSEIQAVTGGSHTAISARLRDFRKPKFGGHHVARRRRTSGHGLFEYQLIVRGQP